MRNREKVIDYMQREMSDGHGETIMQIAYGAGLPYSTARDALQTLEYRGVVQRGNLTDPNNDEKVIGKGWWLVEEEHAKN